MPRCSTTGPGVRTLTTNTEIGEQYSFFMGNGPFVRANPALTSAVIDAFTATADHARTHPDGGCRACWPRPPASRRMSGRVRWRRTRSRCCGWTTSLARSQQKVADRFRALGLMPGRTSRYPTSSGARGSDEPSAALDRPGR